MYDCVIIGRGPAGISAALYTARSGLSTVVIGNGSGALENAAKIENYYGLSAPVSGLALQKRGEEQARSFGVEILETEALGVAQEAVFRVETTVGSLEARSIILAVGKTRKSCGIPGAKELEGKGVSYCAVCDGFFYRGKRVAVIGNGEYAAHEARYLKQIVGDVTVFTNGLSPISSALQDFSLEERKILSITGENLVTGMILEDGASFELDGIFLAIGQASAIDFAQKLGIIVQKNRVVVDLDQMTNVPGVFAAGDCTGRLLQIATAVGDGAIAGQKVVEYVKKMKI